MISEVSTPGGWAIKEVDILARTVSSAVTAGDVVAVTAGALVTAGMMTVGGGAATAAQRRTSIPGVALESAGIGAIYRLRIQGKCKALVKSTGNNAITRSAGLCYGTVKALDADPPAVNTNRWVGRAVSEVAAGSSSTASLQDVVLYGLTGLGINATGT